MKEPVAHGGDLRDVQRRFPTAPRPWIDLSTGINPISYPLPELGLESWTRLPSHDDEAALRVAAARRYGAPDPEAIVAAPGTQALIQLLPRLVPRSRVAVLGPTYEEHETSWRRQGHDVCVVRELAEATDADVVVAVNPNNPTGRLLTTDELRAVRGMLVLDEAFIDLHPQTASLAGEPPENTVILRSFGKTYGLAGVRLGFAIGGRAIVERLRDELGPWAVSGSAIEVGRIALGDDRWLGTTASRLTEIGRRLDGLLVNAGFELLGGTALFRLAAHARAARAADILASHGVHVRSFENEPTWLRFGMPLEGSQLDRLAGALGQFSMAGPSANVAGRAFSASSQTR